MGFAHALGFTGAEEVHHGGVFARAVLGWMYGVAERAGLRLPDGVRDANLAALKAMRPDGERGGWSYFPTLPELAPDADDLAQVIHAFGPGAAAHWDALFDVPVRLVLDHHAHPDGAVDTWIVDPGAPTERQTRYRDAIGRWWGRGVDAEVVANFFAALHAHAPGVAPDAVRAGAEWVAGRQRADGSWTSTWYVGPFYGTFAACRLVSAVLPGHPSLGRAAAFLRQTQRADGGWASNGRSDPLSTALALLALLEAGGEAREPGLDDAVRHLLVSQRSDGLWPCSDFIRMDLSRAAGGPARWATYGSATMAAAFAGAALLKSAEACEAR
jgi:squalene-hopene/tetraprenyl-beta-curcumene cyclase